MSYRLKNHRSYPIWFLLAASVIIAVAICLPDFFGGKRFEIVSAMLGATAGAVYFFYNRHLSQTQFFYTLFTAFNKRYDDLNGVLDKVSLKQPDSASLEAEEKHALYDYFNLCAEEYLFYEAGFIDKKVWQAWLKGMAYFYKFRPIGELWENDMKAESFYGFDLTEVRKLAGNSWLPTVVADEDRAGKVIAGA